VILVDSNVVVEVLRGRPSARDWMVEERRRSGRLAASVLTVTELTGGMRSSERSVVTALLGTFDLLAVDELTAHRAGELFRRFRRSHQGIDVVDYVVAATAQLHGLELATLNVRHFPMFDDLVAPFAV
jgi:predicted nucleic acid-binding protein